MGASRPSEWFTHILSGRSAPLPAESCAKSKTTVTEETSAPDANAGPASRRRPWGLAIAALIVMIGVAAGARIWLYYRLHVSTDDATIEMTMVQVAPKVAGRLHEIDADTGDRVARGQVLARLETEDLEAAVRQAAAGVAAKRKAAAQAEAALAYQRQATVSQNAGAQAALEGSGLRVSQAKVAVDLQHQQFSNELREAQAALKAAEADRTKAEADLVRFDKLFSQGAVSSQEHDAAVSAAANAKANVDAAEARVALAQSQEAQTKIKRQDVAASQTAERQARAQLREAQAAHLQVQLRQAELEAARAQVSEADAVLRLAQITLQNARILCPTDGIVAQKLAEPGEMVSVGQPILTITEHSGPTSRWVIANFEETNIQRVKVGQPATFTVDAYPGHVFHGHVIEVRAGTQSEFSLIPAQQPSGSFTKVTQRVPVKIAIDDENHARLAPGMSVVVSVDVGPRPRERR
jgi:membrane fusion protein (multidrug efflux system)